MTRTVTRFVLPTLCLALAACGGEAERSANDDRAAGGEVLEGTISDDMIPLDQLRSQGEAADPTALDDAEEAGDGEDAPESPAED